VGVRVGGGEEGGPKIHKKEPQPAIVMTGRRGSLAPRSVRGGGGGGGKKGSPDIARDARRSPVIKCW